MKELLIWEAAAVSLVALTYLIYRTDKMTERCSRCERLQHQCECPHFGE